MCGKVAPHQQPRENDNASNWWNQEYLRVVTNVLSGTFHDRNTDFDVVPVTKSAAEKDSCDSPNCICSILIILVVWVSRIHALPSLVDHPASVGSSKNKSENTEVH